ncbi:hypothetical protein M0R45_035633 [Rubus argutus]|uniref:Uncharacterized protein n=1 Tax=Rubus argutus TaxID=59490 RepID=A0AAW1VXH8_RUBAR
MVNAMFSFGEFNLGGVEDKLSYTDSESSIEEESIGGKQVYEAEQWRGFEVESSKLSTEEIMREEGARFIRTASQVFDIPSMLSHPFELSFAGPSNDESRDVELVEFLIASAEKVGSYCTLSMDGKCLLTGWKGTPLQSLSLWKFV